MRPRFASNSQFALERRPFIRICQGLTAVLVLLAFVLLVSPSPVRAEVPSGSLEEAKAYYEKLSTALNYSTPEKIGETTLTDLAEYLGYKTLTAEKLEFDSPDALMADYEHGATPGDVLVARFFAPKIMNVKFKEGEADFRLGWRKLVRLKAQKDSPAQKAAEGKIGKIASAVILFNTFTRPTEAPYGRTNFSVNTQVMLLPDPADIRPLVGQKGAGKMDTVYWLDYQNATAAGPGKLGYALNASFDANELPGAGTKDYFVPHGCVACHAANMQRPVLNFMDTDHWFDRLNNDFPQLKASKLALLYDAETNDPTAPKFKRVFDRIKTFNREADAHAHLSQPKHDETLASARWLELHETNFAPVPPIRRAIGAAPQWPADDKNEVTVLETLNQYCYRCHGTVKFSVFNKQTTWQRRANATERLAPDAALGLKMPPDRDLPKDKRDLLLKFFNP
ncbi:MAG: hypothetical protein J0I06_05050 [Planctomycetes bacterium]|nr:hypothetical protein [Planctomycetota bacterium]